MPPLIERQALVQPEALSGRTALVTGAGSASGLGNAIATSLAGAGARVILADIDVAGAERNAAAIGGEASAVAMDVTDPDSVARALGGTAVDILVNNAGITQRRPIWELTLEEFDHLLAINLRGGFICLKAVLAGMMERRWGRLVWISSVAGKQGGGFVGTAHYAASKAGVIGLCQAAARELGPHGITSNAIAPGYIRTGIANKSVGAAAEQEIESLVERTAPLRRSGTAQDIANAVLFLASESASYITGEVMDVNGGIYFD